MSTGSFKSHSKRNSVTWKKYKEKVFHFRSNNKYIFCWDVEGKERRVEKYKLKSEKNKSKKCSTEGVNGLERCSVYKSFLFISLHKFNSHSFNDFIFLLQPSLIFISREIKERTREILQYFFESIKKLILRTFSMQHKFHISFD